jgi:hypothetical protein
LGWSARFGIVTSSIGTDEKPADLLVNKTSECGFDFMFGAGIQPRFF